MVKIAFKTSDYANINDQDNKKTIKSKILRVSKNPANKDYERRGVITKGSYFRNRIRIGQSIIKTRSTWIINAVLIKQ